MPDTLPSTPLLPVLSALGPRQRRLALTLSDWPAADLARWQRACAPGSLLDDDAGGAAHWRPDTRLLIIRAYGLWLTFLTRQGGPMEPDPAARLSRPQVLAFVAALREGRSWRTVTSLLSHLAMAAAVMFGEQDWQWLKQLTGQARNRVTPSGRKLGRLVSPRQLLELGQTLMAEAGQVNGATTAALRYRDGLMIALLALRPLRRRNLMRLTLGTQLRQQDGRWAILIAGEQTKNHRPIELPFPALLVPALEHYLAVHRPVLLARGAAAESSLWIGNTGRPLADLRAWQVITAHTRQRLGVSVNPHLFRDCAASHLGEVDPEHVRMAAPLLGHASYATTERHYILAQSRTALAQHQALLESLRRPPRQGHRSSR